MLPGEPVEALYVEIGDSAMIFQVRWWIDFHRNWERSYDRIHTALHNALNAASIESPYPSQRLDLQVDGQTLAEVWQAWQGEGMRRPALDASTSGIARCVQFTKGKMKLSWPNSAVRPSFRQLPKNIPTDYSS